MKATVYGIPGSHPVRAGLAMLDRKGIEWKLVDVPTMLCRPYLRALGFPQPTVPAMRFDDGRRLQTTRSISRELDRHVRDNTDISLHSSHPQGGNALSRDPSKGVVGPDFRVHGTERLYLCDASIFPAAITVNPQLTVMGLAEMAAVGVD